MPDFTSYTNEQVLQYLVEHFHEMDAGKPKANLAASLLSGVIRGDVAVERHSNAFAVVGRANRKGAQLLGVELDVPPESDLKILMVAPEARGTGAGTALLADVMEKYMEDQAMTLICQGERRKALFGRAGFAAQGLTTGGLHDMVCPARARENS
jgi:GNAT superfamily N-acetyltransferase